MAPGKSQLGQAMQELRLPEPYVSLCPRILTCTHDKVEGVCLVLFVSALVAVASRKYCCWRAPQALGWVCRQSLLAPSCMEAKHGPHLFGLYTADDVP